MEEVFQTLLAICFEREINMLVPASTCMIKEICSLETYYRLLLRCLKSRPKEGNQLLAPYILRPLEMASRSLYNESLISRVFFT